MIALDLPRLGAAAGIAAAYAALCVNAWRSHRLLDGTPGRADGGGVLIAYASQSGFAHELAAEAAHALATAGIRAHRRTLNQVDAAELSRCDTALFIASTCGEGDAPDNGALFARRVMSAAPALNGLRYGLLALGDSSYARYCGFGRRLDDWLESRGATPIFPRIEVDRAAGAALEAWRHRLASFAGLAEVPETGRTEPGLWRIRARHHLNPGSAGRPAYHVELEPVGGDDCSAPPDPLPIWEPGDLLQLHPPGSDARPRDYSIASLPEDGAVHLLVRHVTGPGGRPGEMSSLLTQDGAEGRVLRGRIRPHPNFRLDDNDARPLLLIGNGTGLAGLLAHLRHRARRGDGRNWLVFGERNAAHDHFHGAELGALERNDLLARYDRVFSRDLPAGEYVQHRLLRAADTVRAWVDGGAAIYVCGNAVGMGPAVHGALAAILGADALDRLTAAGRYRRDIY